MAESQLNPGIGRSTKDVGSTPTSQDWDRPGRESSLGKGPSETEKCGLGDQIKEQAGTLMEGAKDLAEDAKTKVEEAVQTGTAKAEEVKDAAGNQMHHVAEKIRQGGNVVSDKADQLGTYLQEHDFSAIGRDLSDVIRRYPVQSLLVGIGLGILLGRAGRS